MDEHLVRFYDDDDFLIDEIWHFIGPCLQRGDTAVVIATREHIESLERRFAREGLSDAIIREHTEQCVRLDASDLLSRLLVDGWPDEKRFRTIVGDVLRGASKDGTKHVHAYGEMVGLLCERGNQAAAIRIEQLWNELAQEFPLSLLCGYPMHAFSRPEDAAAFSTICDQHMHVFPAESFREGTDANALHRTVAQLQQKANALESEVARRKAIEQALHCREQELSDFLENALEGMHRVSADGTIIWANKAELDLLGYARDEYIGRKITDFHVDRDNIDTILSKLLGGESLIDHAARLQHKDGSIRHVLIRSNPRLVDGEFVSTRCITRDITERVHLEAALEQRLRELAELDRRKDEFLAMLGHELRNPLAPIMNSLELMRIQGDYPEAIARSRETITRQVELMKRLVDDLLDVSRITRGTISLKIDDITLDEVIERAVEIARPLINERQHRLSLNLPADTLHLRGDPARLAQILANLLHNAAKYTEPGGSICVSARVEGDCMSLTIGDNGIGIDPSLHEKVFDLFVQDKKSLSKANGGLGIGLTLVRSLVQLHGGTVSLRSEGAGKGSEFIVTLPLNGAKGGTVPVSSADRSSKPVGNVSRSVLIVDDNIDAAESLGEFLKITGHTTHVVHDGQSALRLARSTRPEVVILDIGMPLMDGYRVAERLRSDVGLTSSVLIAVTGYAQERDRLTAKNAGFDHHFAKPIDMDKLVAILNQPPAQ